MADRAEKWKSKPGPRRWLAALGAFLALIALTATPVRAQYGSTFRNSTSLTDEDIAMARKLVRQELTGKPAGTTLAWNNPKSQNSGTVTLLQDFSSRGRDCRRVRYFIKPGRNQPSGTQSDTYVLTSCRIADGSWHIDNGAQPD